MATVAELRMDVDSRPVKAAGGDLDRLVSKSDRAERELGKLGNGSRRAGRGVSDFAREVGAADRKLGGFEVSVGRTIGRLAAFAGGVIGVVGAIRGLAAGLSAADNFRALDNRIKLVTDSAEEFVAVQRGLIDISRRTFASIDGTVQAYQRMAGATDRLGISQERLLGVAETVNKAVALSGATSQAAEASLIQFGQALSNNFQASAQEINSLNEQVFALSDAIARGITKITGVEVFRSDLKRLAEDGKLSSELVISALEAVKEETDATFNNLDRTFAQVAQRLKTNAQVIAKEAFGPLLNIKIDFYTRLAEALESPRTIEAAQKFGASIVDIAKGFEKNADAIIKSIQGIGAALLTLAGVSTFSAIIRGIAGIRTAVLALNVAVAANPVGLLITGVAAAIGLVVTFRDEITRALTPYKEFKDLSDDVGLAIKGAMKIASDAAADLREILEGVLETIKRILSDLPRVESNVSFNDGLIAKSARAAGTGRKVILGSIFDALKAAGRAGEIAGGEVTFQDVIERYKKSAREAADETGKIGAAANDASKFWGSLSDSAEKSAKEIEKARIAAERAARALASDVSSTFFDIQFGDQLDQFRRIDLFGLNRGQRDSAVKDFEAVIDDLARAIESDSDLSAEARAEFLRRLADENDDFIQAYERANEDHARGIRAAIQSVTGAFIDDLLFNAGRGLGDLFRTALRDVGRSVFVDPISKALSGEGSFIGNLQSSFKNLVDNFGKAGKEIAGTISGSLSKAGQALGSALGGALAGFGVGQGLGDLFGLKKGSTGRRALTGGTTGAAIGLALGPFGPGLLGGAILGAIAGALSKLFSGPKPDFAAGGGVNFQTFRPENQFNKGNANIEARDALLQATSSLAKQLSELTGAKLVGSGISIQVGSRDGTRIISGRGGDVTTPVGDAQAALNEIFRQIIASLETGQNALVDYARAAQASGQSIEEVISVLEVLSRVSKEGVKALSDYAIVAAKAGRSAEQIANGVNALANVYALTQKPLSEVAQRLKDIDDAINPVIDDLKSLGQSFAEIAKIGDDAAKALGENFIQGIRDLNIDLQNSVFGQFNKLLQEIRQREEDARLLLQRGAITQQQFGFVQSTGGLQVSKFFEGLSDDDKESLADFLGLLRTASGDIAVARVKLEEQFDYLIDNVEDTARGFEEAARNFERLAQNLRQTADAIRTEFSGLTPRDNVVTLQGRIAELLNTARDETATTQSRQSALEALPATVTQFVEKARQAFGGTAQFASLRDFGLSALDEAATLSDALAKFNQKQADAAREDVRLLTDIRELLNDDRQLPTLQAILDEGRLTNQLISQQLQAFLNLMATAGSNLNQITAEQLQQAAAAYLAQQQQTIASQTPSPTSSGSAPVSTPTAITTTDPQVAQVLADQAAATDRNSAAINRMAAEIGDLSTEIRRYALKLGA